MMQNKTSGLDRSNLPDDVVAAERRKSNLILEANLLQYQGQYEAAADKFANAAEIEEQLARQLQALSKPEKAFIHHFSALSCWVQAGDLHRALVLGQQLLRDNHLPSNQRQQVNDYLNTLRDRLAQWMSQWASEPANASD
jgi:hypothetical protein